MHRCSTCREQDVITERGSLNTPRLARFKFWHYLEVTRCERKVTREWN
jgi:hypothetical protein